MQSDTYKTLLKPAQAQLKEKGSRFIAQAAPVNTRTAAELFVKKISEQHYDATHNCFAYRVGWQENEETRYNDDGEPAGTAGKPILQAVTGRDLTHIVVVVTRYFGGTKLGTGGLVRAYGKAAGQALDAGKIVTRYITTLLGIEECPYELTNTVMKAVDKYDAELAYQHYDTHATFQLRVRSSQLDSFMTFLKDESGGKLNPQILE